MDSFVAISLYKKDFQELYKRAREGSWWIVVNMLQWADVIVSEKDTSDNPIVTLYWAGVTWNDGGGVEKFIMDFLHEEGRKYSFKYIGDARDPRTVKEETNTTDWSFENSMWFSVRINFAGSATNFLSVLEEQVQENTQPEQTAIEANISFDDVLGGI